MPPKPDRCRKPSKPGDPDPVRPNAPVGRGVGLSGQQGAFGLSLKGGHNVRVALAAATVLAITAMNVHAPDTDAKGLATSSTGARRSGGTVIGRARRPARTAQPSPKDAPRPRQPPSQPHDLITTVTSGAAIETAGGGNDGVGEVICVVGARMRCGQLPFLSVYPSPEGCLAEVRRQPNCSHEFFVYAELGG